jgi:release factor glutamine methyltransferase
MLGATTARDALAAAVTSLAAAGCDTPRLDAELMIADALGVSRAALIADPAMPVAGAASRLLSERIRRRAMREPVAYILGRQAFRDIELAVDNRVLIPRPETELLVECAITMEEGAHVHNLGTGSGAIALAIKQERPDMHVTASDSSPDAIAVARANAARLHLDVAFVIASGWPELRVQSPLDGASAVAGTRPSVPDLVVANLPYVADGDWGALQPEIRLYEPRLALIAGADGLDAIRALVASAPAGTQLALEHAPDQAAAVRALLVGGETLQDLAGRDRVTLGSVP